MSITDERIKEALEFAATVRTMKCGDGLGEAARRLAFMTQVLAGELKTVRADADDLKAANTRLRNQGEERRKELTAIILDITCNQCGPIPAEDVHLLTASSPHGDERCITCGNGVEIRQRNALAELNEAAHVRAELEAAEHVLDDLRNRRDALLARCAQVAPEGKVRLLDCREIQSAFYNPLPAAPSTSDTSEATA